MSGEWEPVVRDPDDGTPVTARASWERVLTFKEELAWLREVGLHPDILVMLWRLGPDAPETETILGLCSTGPLGIETLNRGQEKLNRQLEGAE